MLVAQLPVRRRGRRRRLIDYGRGGCLRSSRSGCSSRRVYRRCFRRGARAPPPLPRLGRFLLDLSTLVPRMLPRRTMLVALPAPVAHDAPRARRRVCRRAIATLWCRCRSCCWFLLITIVLTRLHLTYVRRFHACAVNAPRGTTGRVPSASTSHPKHRSTAQRLVDKDLGATTPALVSLTPWGRRDAPRGPSRAQLPGGWRVVWRSRAVGGAQGVLEGTFH